MEQRIVGFHMDDEHHWVADLECGHTQHVRHDPPWQMRPWVITPEGRDSRLGAVLKCRECDRSRHEFGRAQLKKFSPGGIEEQFFTKRTDCRWLSRAHR